MMSIFWIFLQKKNLNLLLKEFEMNHTILEKFPKLLHGGDYNPEQWLDRPDILSEDIRLMKLAGINNVSLGIFSWSFLEPEEGHYNLDYMAEIIDRLYENGIYVDLATPTGAMPNWLTKKYPEVLQTDENGIQNLPGKRHNFCYTSPVMREKTRKLDEALAKHFGNHPGVILWHISNEYGGNFRDASCHCDKCRRAFRRWLKKKYKTLDHLNKAWWTGFWSHTYTDWKQIHSPSPHGEDLLHGLNLDWHRFVSDQLQDFCHEEIKAVQKYSDLPTTVNMMRYFEPLDYDRWAKEVDIISWDAYPLWHTKEDEIPIAVWAAAMHNQMRSFKKAPFLLMESTPSMINWQEKNMVKRPGMHYLSSMQAVAHGSNSVLYFQWRKSRGSFEKFHGAVVGHDGTEHTRVFKEVVQVGETLNAISDKVYNTCNVSKAAIIMDWENWWALKDAAGPKRNMDYVETILEHYRPFWEMGIEVDIVSMEMDLTEYQLVVAPLCYMYKKEYIEQIKTFVHNGGTYVATYWSGIVDETDLCFLGKNPLAELLGLSVDEIDVGNEFFPNEVLYQDKKYPLGELRETVTIKGADVLGAYTSDYNAKTAAVTKNTYGRGAAYYIAAEMPREFLLDFYREVCEQADVKPNLSNPLPYGVTVSKRSGATDIYFLQNYNRTKVEVDLPDHFLDLVANKEISGKIQMEAYQCLVMEKQ